VSTACRILAVQTLDPSVRNHNVIGIRLDVSIRVSTHYEAKSASIKDWGSLTNANNGSGGKNSQTKLRLTCALLWMLYHAGVELRNSI
jgi:hypothetical protein